MSVKEQTSLESRTPPQRVRVDCNEVSFEQLKKHWQEQEKYVDHLSSMMQQVEDRLKQHMQDSARRESVLGMRLTAKEHELQELLAQVTVLKASQSPGLSSLRSHILDPAVNLILEKIKKELVQSKSQVENIQNELNAWKFTPDSHTGKRLMAKCRMLLTENEELGQMVSTGILAKLEGDLALQKNLCATLKNSQAELDELLPDLDEDVEGMQVTIYHLQQQLKEAKEQIHNLQAAQNTPQLNGGIIMQEHTSENSQTKDRTKEAQTKDRTKEATSHKERDASELTADDGLDMAVADDGLDMVAAATATLRTSVQKDSSNKSGDISSHNGQEDWSVNALDSRTKESPVQVTTSDQSSASSALDCHNYVQVQGKTNDATNDQSCLFQNNVEQKDNKSQGDGRKETKRGRGRRTRRRPVTNNSPVSEDSNSMAAPLPPPKRTRYSAGLNKQPVATQPLVENGVSPEEKVDTSF